MKTVFTYSFKRPDKSIPFYEESSEFQQYINEKYINSGKCLSFRQKKISEDGLFQEVMSEWADIKYAEEFWEDPLVLDIKQEIIFYNLSNGISTTDAGRLQFLE